MSSTWRTVARIAAVVSGMVVAVAPGTVALADEAAPPGAAAATPAEQRAGDPAGVALVVGLSLGGAWPVAVTVTVGAEGAGGTSTGATSPAEMATGQLVTLRLSPAEGQSPIVSPGSALVASSAAGAGSSDQGSPPRIGESGLGAIGRVGPCGARGQAGADCGLIGAPGGEGAEGGGSARPTVVTEEAGCPVGCPAPVEPGEPLGTVGVDRGEVDQPAAGPSAPQAPAAPARSRPAPPLASTGSPVAAGLAGLLMVLLGAFLSWRRAHR
ncbi:MAG TPA: hypothetical protein VKY90_04425 [Candidatus Dormibacteraeota bacterium]|nr:hypothetical protein [Candidatus Dormibacteraeota bacterium]